MAFRKTTTSEKIRPLTVEEILEDPKKVARKVTDQSQAAPQRESSRGA